MAKHTLKVGVSTARCLAYVWPFSTLCMKRLKTHKTYKRPPNKSNSKLLIEL